ncbi:hypothetical protein K402DRAFT_414248 [Aulographum hederae CBS 113979]|uniref:BZIP domain-containing protein n=1 Tax=Aulographum hederae CBS 113979 TaxID=1176131 RepID=A0A6G1GSB6_9PEZI|nr:hypothetical protein K402DRAFT_414248 [Aulographum hederae CBS 113979]
MDYSYFSTAQQYSYEPVDPTYNIPNYDAYRYQQAAALLPNTTTSPGSPLMPIGSIDSGLGQDGMEQGRRDSSEEKETLTPAQSRRKAQNRAAQRAFRERKERHVKDLEAKLTALESSATHLATDNERLKLALQRAHTENEILRATGSPTHTRRTSYSHASTGPQFGTSAAFDAAVDPTYTAGGMYGGYNNAGYSSSSNGQLLPAGATWDLIQSHPLVRQGHVDVADVCERLRNKARCDGQGPVFAEAEVWRAVEESRRGGGDELI